MMLDDLSKMIKRVSAGRMDARQLGEIVKSPEILKRPFNASELAKAMETNYPALAAKLWCDLLRTYGYPYLKAHEPFRALKRLKARKCLIEIVQQVQIRDEQTERSATEIGLEGVFDLDAQIKGAYRAVEVLYELKDVRALTGIAYDTSLYSRLREVAEQYLKELHR